MAPSERLLEDALAIRMLFQRLLLANEKVTMAFRTERREFTLLAVEADGLALGMERPEFETWKLAPAEKVSMTLEDRGFKYEAVLTCEGLGRADDQSTCKLELPRSLRRADANRLVDFAPDHQDLPRGTFSNSKNVLLDGQVTGFGRGGLELSLLDPRQKVQDYFRIGEESTLDLPLGGNLHLVAPARVAYVGDRVVGLEFTDKADKDLLGSYRTWLDDQERLQAQRDREDFESGGRKNLRRGSAELPPARLLVDRDPLILLLTENEDFARRIADGLGRKFGFLALDYIKGPVIPLLKEWNVSTETWGRIRLVLIHNRLRLASPLELCRQLVDQEKCGLPILIAGAEDDLDLKRVRALEAGAVDYLAVDPFKILSILKKLDEMIQLFQA